MGYCFLTPEQTPDISGFGINSEIVWSMRKQQKILRKPEYLCTMSGSLLGVLWPSRALIFFIAPRAYLYFKDTRGLQRLRKEKKKKSIKKGHKRNRWVVVSLASFSTAGSFYLFLFKTRGYKSGQVACGEVDGW